MSRAADFMKNHPIKGRKRSVLFDFKEDIQELREAGATYAYIQGFLREHGVTISIVNLRKFVITHIEEKVESVRKDPKNRHINVKNTLSEASTSPTQEKTQEEAIKSRVANYVPPSWAKGTKIEELL